MTVAGLPALRETVLEQLAENARTHGNVEAVIAAEGRLTYAQLANVVATTADQFDAAGLRAGDRIGLLLPNGIRWVVSVLAAQSLGLVPVPISTWSRSTELSRLAARTLPRMIVTSDVILGKDPRPLLEECGFPVGSQNPLAPYLGTAVWPAAEPSLPLPLASRHPVGKRPPIDAHTVALVLSTSGSTSEPKLVPLLQGPMLANARLIGARQGVVPGDRVWLGAPLFFSYGCANCLPMVLTHAATLCLQEGVDGDEALAMIEAEGCTVYYGFGPTTRKLVEAASFGARDISSLRTGTTGFSVEEKALARETLAISRVCSVYGMTEAYGHSAMTTCDDDDATFYGGQGRALDSQEIRIVDADTLLPLSVGSSGEIQLRGAVTPGYLTYVHGSFTPDGWFRTGDIGMIDAQGRLTYQDRIKSLLKINGINVSPAEIESVLLEHDGVAQAFVFGDTVNGSSSAVAAVVQSNGDPWEDLVVELAQFVRARAASYKVPARFIRVESSGLPLTDTGKINKRELAERLLGAT